jgi:hypothetical protein
VLLCIVNVLLCIVNALLCIVNVSVIAGVLSDAQDLSFPALGGLFGQVDTPVREADRRLKFRAELNIGALLLVQLPEVGRRRRHQGC